ncbi:MAG TPA: potassium transporter TrkG, partial [Bacteroidales bacterium]
MFDKDQLQIAIYNRIKRIPLIVSLLAIICFLRDTGFGFSLDKSGPFQLLFIITSMLGVLSTVGRYLIKDIRPRPITMLFDAILVCYLVLLITQYFQIEPFLSFFLFSHPAWLYLAIFLVFIREFSAIKISFTTLRIHPALLFVLSFLALIIMGGLLLMLPKATHSGISLIDAMFTSTSAVCVTGLVVVDTGSYFTAMGQRIILILIQIGGIGIMTFASYFSYFFTGVSSFQHQLILREMTNTDKLAEVFATLKRILLITFLIEGIGALLIFHTIDAGDMPLLSDRLFFSVFHSVSGFCNAGFSTLHNNLYEAPFRLNYPMHITLAFLIILGGIGFPIVFNLLKYLQTKIRFFFLGIYRRRKQQYTPWLININTKIVLTTTLILIVAGTLFLFILEYNNTLSAHSLGGKVATAFFTSVTTRTAGFNTVDIGAMSVPSLLFILFLMWVGASPGSTGGGIKTSSLAVAVLNFISIARGKSRLEVYHR